MKGALRIFWGKKQIRRKRSALTGFKGQHGFCTVLLCLYLADPAICSTILFIQYI